MLEALAQKVRMATVEVGPIPSHARATLVDEVVRLEPQLAAYFEARTAGDPLFLIHLLENCVQRGQLRRGPEGFRLDRGAVPMLPEHVSQLWRERIEALLQERPFSNRIALEVAAALGQRIVWKEWQATCSRVGVEASVELVSELVRLRLAWVGSKGPRSGWQFVHGMLRDSVEAQCKAAGRSPLVHRACADMLAEATSSDSQSERAGRHIARAGDAAKAIDPLLRGAHERMDRSELRAARRLLVDIHTLTKSAEIGANDPRAGNLLAAMARLDVMRGRYGAARATLEKLESGPADPSWEVPRLHAQIERGVVQIRQGKRQVGLALLRDAVRRSAGTHPHQHVAALAALGDGLFWVSTLGTTNGSHPLDARATSLLAVSEREEMLACYEEAAKQAKVVGNQAAYQDARSGLDFAAVLGGTIEQQRRKGEGLDRPSKTAGDGHDAFAALLHAQVEFKSGKYSTALELLHIARERFQRQGRTDLEALVFLGLAACEAELGSWDECGLHSDVAMELLGDSGLAIPLIPGLAMRTADLAAAAGRQELSFRLHSLALQQVEILGQPELAPDIEP